MNIKFVKLTPQMADEFLHYFENDAFPENEYIDVEKRREKAKEPMGKSFI